MVCYQCPNANGTYNHCTCYLHGVHNVDPANGNMFANAWYSACNLNAPPPNSTKYLICSSSHVAIRNGNTYYYHPGSAGAAPKTKEHV